MKQRRRGITITELLVVVSVITILTSMMSPVLMRAQKEAIRRGCISNMGQISMALELIRNDNAGKLPQCFDLNGTAVDEKSWWFRKVARKLYPHDNTYDQLTVPPDHFGWWNTAASRIHQKFRPERVVLRCPASRDPYVDRTISTTVMRRCGWSNSSTEYNSGANRDKDRVYDDNYGYNMNGFNYSTYSSVPNPDSPGGGNILGVTTAVYHTGGVVSGAFVRNSSTAVNNTYIGQSPDPLDPAGTILLMDYIKADAQPYDSHTGGGAAGRDGLNGYRFRHGDRANVLFADGHAEGYRKRTFLAQVGGRSAHWRVKVRP